MDVLLQGYDVNRPTWFYLSLILVIAVYCRFTRIFSLRNLDLLLLLSASPGLIFVGSKAPEAQFVGHAWLLGIACLFLLRLFIDPFLNRRPYLGQNLNSQGMGFLCASAFAFLMTQAITESPVVPPEPVVPATVIQEPDVDSSSEAADTPAPGPAAPLIAAGVELMFEELAARILAILSHVAVISGLWFAGRNLFADKSLGLAMATLYLLLPCTAYNVGEFNHVLPAACIVWAFVCYRKPVVSGILLGLACGTMFFPIFLLPIWATYYGRRGAGRFVLALGCVALVLLGSLALTSTDPNSFVQKTIGSINVALSTFSGAEARTGFWSDMGYMSVYRLPVMVAYFVMLIVMTVWPKHRTVEVLLAQSTAAIVGTQLWYHQAGGVFLLWYLPLMLMVIFRPRLIHLRNPADDDVVSNGSVKVAGRAPHAPLMARATSNRSLQLFR